jgi:hypothetical protein
MWIILRNIKMSVDVLPGGVVNDMVDLVVEMVGMVVVVGCVTVVVVVVVGVVVVGTAIYEMYFTYSH